MGNNSQNSKRAHTPLQSHFQNPQIAAPKCFPKLLKLTSNNWQDISQFLYANEYRKMFLTTKKLQKTLEISKDLSYSPYLHSFQTNTNYLYTYDIMRKKGEIIRIQNGFVGFGYDSLQIQKNVYLIGGMHNAIPSSSCFHFDFIHSDFIKKHSMFENRIFHKIVAAKKDRFIYALGGWNNEEDCMNTCERFNIRRNKWI
jgi:hypothetical protein